MSDKTRCQCGRKKWHDANVCDKCWDSGAKYDERRDPKSVCPRCGGGKYSDESLCGDCWDAESAWDDGR